MRLVTKQSKTLSKPVVRRRATGRRGLVVDSAEGFRFAHADTYVGPRTQVVTHDPSEVEGHSERSSQPL
jgi:hypothetical protein